jgi:2-polyprenyl-3-methyl-5-hydroxy-6-metoxy-1,4-benzoquinol methylase
LYDGITRADWEDELKSQRDWNKKHMLCALAYFRTPSTLLDAGCGDGAMVQMCRAYGVEAYGIDQLVQPNWPSYFIQHNLVDHFRMPDLRQFGMVLCIEVAEHLHESAHATLCDTLYDNLAPGGFLLFSAAHPGQGGMGHVSERSSAYWHIEFSLRGLNYRHDYSTELALLWSHIRSPLYWLPANIMVWEK